MENVAGCTIVNDSGRNLYLCSSADSAKLVFLHMSNNLPGLNDNVCIKNSNFSERYYTCYTSPGQPVFDSTYGTYRDFDPLIDDDTMAEDLAPNIDTFCASYAGNTQKLKKAIESTNQIYIAVSNTLTSAFQYGRGVKGLIDTYCSPARGNRIKACATLNTSYNGYFKNSNTEYQGLITTSNILRESLTVLRDLSTQTYNVYKGSKCDTLPAYAHA